MPDRPLLHRLPGPRLGSSSLRRHGAAVLFAGVQAVILAAAGPGWTADGGAGEAAKKSDPFAIQTRNDKADGSSALTMGRRLDTEWDAKVGVDVGLSAPLTTTPSTDAYLKGWAQQDRSTGVGWANVIMPLAPPGWDKAAVDARIDPAQDQGQFGTTLSRSVPLSDDTRMTIRNGYSVTETLVNPGGMLPSGAIGSTQTLATENVVSVDVLSSATTFAAGAKMSNTDDKWLRSLSAEQKLFGGPISVTGAISERATGETDRSVKAGFKAAW